MRLGLQNAAKIPVLTSLLFGLAGLILTSLTMPLALTRLLKKNAQPFIIGLVTAFLTLTIYFAVSVAMFSTSYPLDIAALASFWSLIFGFLNGGIAGCSIYLHKILERKSQTSVPVEERGTELLKLEHSWSLTAFQSVSYAAMIFVVSAVLVCWTQMVLPQVPTEKFQTVGMYELFMTTVIQLVYVGTGLWLGIVGKLLGYSLRIQKRMLD